jgi:hypothetical protein
MGEPGLWTVAALVAAALVLGSAIYIGVRWNRAPAALHALISVAGVCFVAGLLGGLSIFDFVAGQPMSASSRRTSSPPASSAALGSVPALEVGKAIVETDEKHAGDPNWASSAESAELCNEGALVANSLLCRVTYLARHALGKDLNRGPHKTSISLSDVADFCDSGDIDKGSDLCRRAYAARNAGMR